jgi:hypothetical protein
MSSSFLAVYDYGQGGVWLLLDAPSAEVARGTFPTLTIFETRPEWMSEECETSLRSACEAKGFRWNALETPSGWLFSCVRERAAP